MTDDAQPAASGQDRAALHGSSLDRPLDWHTIDDDIARWLDEDIGTGDITAGSVIPADTRLDAVLRARHGLVAAGLPLAARIFRRLDPGCRLEQPVSDGAWVDDGTVLMRVDGRARALLSAERTALNIVQHLSGIATLTRAYVTAVSGTGAVVLDTRKTIPGLRHLAKYATALGGANNHRMGLFDAVMIKDNHIAVAGSVTAAVAAAQAAGHTAIQVECDTPDQVEEALRAGTSSLLLDNMSVATLHKALSSVDHHRRATGKRIPAEASGGVTLDSIRAIAETGVDFISVGRLTQSAPAADIGLDFAKTP